MSKTTLKRPRRKIAVRRKGEAYWTVYEKQEAVAKTIHVARALVSMILNNKVKGSQVLKEYDLCYRDTLSDDALILERN